MPTAYFIAGCNGAGKTTFAQKFLPKYVGCFEFVNADLIAKGLSPFAPERVAMHAGRLTLERVEELASSRVDFALETTLSGRVQLRLLRSIRSSLWTTRETMPSWLPITATGTGRLRTRPCSGRLTCRRSHEGCERHIWSFSSGAKGTDRHD